MMTFMSVHLIFHGVGELPLRASSFGSALTRLQPGGYPYYSANDALRKSRQALVRRSKAAMIPIGRDCGVAG
jgi:hypothetical protein